MRPPVGRELENNMKTRKELVAELIMEKAATPSGFNSADAGEKDRKYAGKLAKQLADAGKLFKFNASQNVKMFYFTTARAATEFAGTALVLNSKPHQHLKNPAPQPKESPLETVVRLAAPPAPAEVKRWPGLVYPTGFKASIKPASYTPLNPAKDCALAPARRASVCKIGVMA